MSPVCGLQTLLKKLKVKKLLMNVQRISSYIMDPIVGNFCPFFTLILTVCELQTFLKMRYKKLMNIVHEIFSILSLS